MTINRVLLPLVSLCASPVLLAQSMDAHTHGHASLDIALEGNSLALRFVSPAADIYGFEHAAMNARQSEIVETAVALMEQPAWLVGELANQCALQESDVQAGVELMASEDHSHEHDHAHAHAHAENHDDGHEHEHEHSAENEDEHEHETHAEVVAEYQLLCSDAPGEIRVTAFTHFESLQEIEVQWVSEMAQGGADLTAQNPVVLLNAR